METVGFEEGAAAGFAAAAWDGALDGDDEEGPPMGLAFEAFLNPMELKMARRFVADLAPQDAQEEVHAWHLAAGHLLAAQRIGKSRQDGITPRAEQIEVGLAVRLMTLADRKSTALDRHRAFRLKTVREAAHDARMAAQIEEMNRNSGRWGSGYLPPLAQHEARRPAHLEPEHPGREACAEPGAPAAQAASPGLSPGQAPGLSRGQAPSLSRGQAPSQAPLPRPDSELAADPTPMVAAGAGSLPGTGSGSPPEAGPKRAALTRQQRRALERQDRKTARRAKKAALSAAAMR